MSEDRAGVSRVDPTANALLAFDGDTHGADLKPGSSLHVAAEAFDHWLRTLRTPPNTLLSYHYDLQVLRGQAPEATVGDLANEQIAEFLGAASSPATRKRRLTTLKRFYRFLIDVCKLDIHDPTEAFIQTRIELKVPQPLSVEEQAALREAATRDEGWSAAAIALMLDCGLSRHELLSLERANVDRSSPRTVRIEIVGSDTSRPGQSRTLPVPPGAAETLTAYLADHAETRLFPYGFQAVNGMVHRLRRKAKLQRSVTPRLLRETWIIKRVQAGASLDELIAELGMADEYRNRQSLARYLAFRTPEQIPTLEERLGVDT